ncbi:MAG: spermidine/putrescine ABC transporter substrate-binding protein [Oscillospiraceae bacterium]|nr:spermidine/putrescine ABC transporter substrate-binding protein [Oscillospiraceae bacterium]
MRRKLCACALLLALLAALPKAWAAENEINVYNWGQYIADGTDGAIDVIREFEAATGIHVNYSTFDSNETLRTKLLTGGASYDVIIPSDYMIGWLIGQDMLEPLNFDNIPNYQYVDDAFKNMTYDPENRYSVPYTWGTTGLIYNTRYVAELDSWTALWDPAYAGKILMFDNCRDAFAISQLILGHDLNTEDPVLFQAEADRLREQKPLVQQYVMDQIFSKMEREEAWIAPYYAGDYLTMVEENPNLAFCHPKEGFNLFVDAACIPKGCANKAGAEAFINFLCDPEVSGRNLDYLGYSTPISAAKAYMDPETAANPVAYPDAETLERGKSFSALSQASNQQMDALWLEVRTSGSDTTRDLLLSGAVILAVVALMLVQQQRRRRRKARRCRSRTQPPPKA